MEDMITKEQCICCDEYKEELYSCDMCPEEMCEDCMRQHEHKGRYLHERQS